MSCPSSIRHRDWNPRPLEHEVSPITTRPGLPSWASNSLQHLRLKTIGGGTYLPMCNRLPSCSTFNFCSGHAKILLRILIDESMGKLPLGNVAESESRMCCRWRFRRAFSDLFAFVVCLSGEYKKLKMVTMHSMDFNSRSLVTVPTAPWSNNL